MRTLLATFNNSCYKPASKSRIAVWYIVNALFFNTSIPYPSKLKVFILRFFGAIVGKNLVIKPMVNIKYPWLLKIGNNVWIGEGVWIDNLDYVDIGNNVCISQGAYLLTGSHNYKKSSFDLILSSISLSDGVWIGARAIVCPGVTCKNHSVLSVGSVATHNLEEYCVYQGNPAQFKRKREIEC